MIIRKSLRFSFWIMGLLAAFIVTGCPPTQIKTVKEYSGALPRPDHIFVYDFATSPDDVDVTKGIISELEGLVKKTPRSKEEKAVGRAVADALSRELVKEIQNFGLPAERAAGTPPVSGNILEIEGQFLSIDEGNRAERVIIGFGLGRTDVKANVQVYDATAADRRVVEKFTTTAKSGSKPGMALFVGAGALMGHAAVSALVSGGVSAASEKFSANVEADAKRTAKDIAKKLGQFFVEQKWIPASAVK
jgi:Domain of unknown function (DUF4410)